MFWRFGAYNNVSNLNTLLEKPDVTLEEVLEEQDLIQELKQSNSRLIEYLREDNILKRMLEYVVTSAPPRPEEDEDAGSDDETEQPKSLSPFRRSKDKEKTKQQEELEQWEKVEKERSKFAYNCCEILSSETWSILEALMDNPELLKGFWQYMNREPPLDPTAAGYFTKINENLLDKKTEEMIRFLQGLDGVIPAMLTHIDCAAVMDLLLKIISMEKSDGGCGVVDWLQNQDLIPSLLFFLDQQHAPGTQTSAGDFMKAVVTISANASQNEQSCIGPNNLTRQLVSEECMENLLTNMLRGGNALTVGVGLIIEIIRKNNSDYDPDINSVPESIPTSNDPIYLGTMLRSFSKRVPDFMALLFSPTHSVANGDSQITVARSELGVASGSKIEPLGFDRFKTCELMAELLHCSNMGLLNERGSEAFIRQRDEERERLRKEGVLKAVRPPDSAVTEFSEDSGFHNGMSSVAANPPKETRKLEIANNSSEDDGFEEVVHPTEEPDDVKDDFDEKTSFEVEPEIPSAIVTPRPSRPRLDLDDEFVDEPLGSPKLESVDESGPDTPSDDIPAPLHPKPSPTSPTAGLSSQIGELLVNEGKRDSEPLQALKTSNTETLVKSASEPDKIIQPDEILSPESQSPGVLSPHPEDTPAPLFAPPSKETPKVVDVQTEDTETQQDMSDVQASDVQEPPAGPEDPDFSTDMDQNYELQFEYDIDGQPMVGDFLKIMFVEHKVVPTILEFFFRFPWNNFLHNVVYDVVQQVFNGPMDRGYNRTLAIDLFQTGRITERIVDGQVRSDDAQTNMNMRLGYMGHLTLVAEEVVKFSDRHAPEMLGQHVLEAVTSQRWIEYVDNTLTETRERDNAILGGVRPDMSLGPRQAVLNAVGAGGGGFGSGPSVALANAGLNGGTGLDSMDLATNGSATSGSFGLSSGSLLSGFASSSDEEDEEMEEIEETEAGAGGAQDHLLSMHVNSGPQSDPPSAPPPLNLPPSRARNKLAARLARHNQQKNESSTSDGDGDESLIPGEHDDNSDEEEEEEDQDQPISSPHSDSHPSQHDSHTPPQADEPNNAQDPDTKQSKLTSKYLTVGHLDLESFANSPAATEAEDNAAGSGASPASPTSSDEMGENLNAKAKPEVGPSGSEEDVEMRVALG